MNAAELGRVAAGNYLGVSYQAKGMFSAAGGYKAGYRFDVKEEWTWNQGKFQTLNAAVDAACALAREAISAGDHEVQHGGS